MARTRLARSSRLVASLLLLISLWGSPHRQQDDDACLPPVAGDHDASKHAFAPLGPADHGHCAVCHWMRGLKPAFMATSFAWTGLDHAHALTMAVSLVPVAPAFGRLPARAPPATF